MEQRIKLVVAIAGFVLVLSGCQNPAINESSGGRSVIGAPSAPMKQQPETSMSNTANLIVPNDKQVVTAMNEALPTIGKVLAIHRCVKGWQSLRLMNAYAVPGVDMTRAADNRFSVPNDDRLKYHDHNKCVSVTTLDNWTMPAQNALIFRAIYFADDSGETVNFGYLFKKSDEGLWKIASFCSSSYLYDCDSGIVSILRN